MEVQYSDFDEKYSDQLLALHKATFGQDDGANHEMQQLIVNGKCVLAVSDEKLVGYGLGAPMYQVPDKGSETHLKFINSLICWSESEELRNKLAEVLSQSWNRVVRVRGFEQEETENIPVAQGSDWHMSFLAVDENFRKQGIGRRLVQKRIDHARNEGVEKVFALLHVAHEGVVRIYKHEGFQPIIEISNAYPDGSPTRLVYKKLKSTSDTHPPASPR